MSAAWAPMLPLAMVGTDRQASPLPAWPGDVGQLVIAAALTDDGAAAGLLRAASVLATCALAGAQGSPWPHTLPVAAADDALPALSNPPAMAATAWALSDGPARLQHEALSVLMLCRLRLPPALLPQALDLGRRSLSLRPALLPVLGDRGLWLASQRDDWQYAAGVGDAMSDETRWSEGSFEQRRDLLMRERTADPSAARQRLTNSLNELPAKERADLVAVLSEGLGAADEPLLDSLCSDRSREVRQAACDLLLRLPGSAHVGRATARVAPLLRHERVLLRKQWQIDAPAAVEGDWKADSLDAARPKNDTLGERAWWLYQLVRQVPLAWWTQHTGMTPTELLRWADGTDWSEALLRGWRDVLFAAPEVAWCEALLDAWPGKTLRDDPAAVLALLPAAMRERHWLRELRDPSIAPYALIAQILAACPAGEMVSPALSAALVDVVVQRAAAGSLGSDYALRASLPELCCALQLDVLDRLARLPRHADESASLAPILHTVTEVIGARRGLHHLLTTRTP